MKSLAKVLLVEDSPSDAEVLQESLRQVPEWSFEFTWVETLAAALERLAQDSFDVLLLDLSLPDSTGTQTFLRAREAAPRLPIVVLTGNYDESVGLEAVRHGVQDYLIKSETDGPRVARAIRYAVERTRAEESLRESEERYRLLFDGMTEGFAIHEILCDERGEPTDYRFLDVNPAFERLTGLRREDVVGKLHSVVLPNDDPSWVRTYGSVALTGEPARFENYSPALKRHYEVYAYQPAPRRFAVVFMDVTARKELEQRLAEAQKMEAIGVLAGGIAHDFNNLLVGVIGNASLVEEMVPPRSEARALLQRVVATGEQAAHLTRQLLAYAGKGRIKVEPLDLSEVISVACDLLRSSFPKKVEVTTELAKNLPPVVADRGQVNQVFMNLAFNAAEAIGSEGGRISIRVGTRTLERVSGRREPSEDLPVGRYVFLEVSDTGCGMDEGTRARIFDPFFSTKSLGRGLGLAAVSGIVRSCRGAIQVASSPGKGSRFTVLFPAGDGPTAQPTVRPGLRNLRGAGTVLVVDDEEVVREMAAAALQRYGYDVLVAQSGTAGVDLFAREAERVALVILDLSMPEMGGDEVLPKLLQIRPQARVIISSGYNEAEAMKLFGGLRVSGFIQKPYTSVRLAEKVKEMIG